MIIPTHTHTHIPISTYMYMRIPTATHSLRMLNRCDFNLIFFSNLILMVIIFQLKISLHIYVFVCLYVQRVDSTDLHTIYGDNSMEF